MASDLSKIVDDATPGPWKNQLGTIYPIDSDLGPVVAELSSGVEIAPGDADFIATFDPVMVKSLLGVVEAAEAMLDSFDGDGYSGHYRLEAALDRLCEVYPQTTTSR